jgi:transcriptional regulator with XRE-family HTH domain
MQYVLDGAEMRRRRKAKGLSSTQLAANVGRAEQTLSGYERNTSVPSVGVLGRICDVLGCKPSDLLVPVDERASA